MSGYPADGSYEVCGGDEFFVLQEPDEFAEVVDVDHAFSVPVGREYGRDLGDAGNRVVVAGAAFSIDEGRAYERDGEGFVGQCLDAEVALEFAVSVEARRVHVCEVGDVFAVVAVDVHAAEQDELADAVVLGVACDLNREVAVHAVKQAAHILRDMVDMRNAGTVNHRIEALPVRLLPRMVTGRRDGNIVAVGVLAEPAINVLPDVAVLS